MQDNTQAKREKKRDDGTSNCCDIFTVVTLQALVSYLSRLSFASTSHLHTVRLYLIAPRRVGGITPHSDTPSPKLVQVYISQCVLVHVLLFYTRDIKFCGLILPVY